MGSVFMAIVDINFQYFKRRYFIEKVDVHSVSRFLLTSLGYISLLYVLLYYSVNGLKIHNVYYLLSGLPITALLTGLGVTIGYAKTIYKLYRSLHIEGKLKIENRGKITLIDYDDIAFAYSQNKIAYIVKTNGTSVASDFTLNEIEEKIKAHSFYRANRQTILHASSVEQVQSIENGKLSVQLKPALANRNVSQLIISRYKKHGFLDWFKNRS
ncbi:LytR/AlgR family response regulator transcription factor [Roseivirga sp. BDSF3-8]|uniref:LytR/AlgR family response regulator transcription factor n=1 Tax=Roseivirga sp. BDSF3-8 TaxID=3241598 RepID=UPI00353203BB